MNRMHNHTPKLGITALAQGKRWGQAIHGHQPQPRRLPLQAPEQESPGVGADHVAPRAGLDDRWPSRRLTGQSRYTGTVTTK